MITIKNILSNIKSWIVRNSKFLIYALILIVGISVMHSFFNKDTPPITDPVSYKDVNLWRDKYNKEHATLVQVKLEKEIFKRQVDSISQLLKVKPKNIKGVTSVTTKVDTQFYPKLIYIDSLKSFGFSKKDNYLALSGVIRADSSVKINLGLVDTLTIVPFRKTSFFKETFAVDVSNKNPYNHIVSGYSYIRTERTKRFGIGPNVVYNPVTGKMSWGVGLQYNIIRF